ncbi:MAG: phosphatase [Clostridiales bacterium]|nr:phosphatase [Clostridiales bacterium]
MNILVDTHTHTLASGHAYSTIEEMARAASENGIKLLGITEHAPSMPGTCNDFYFHNLKVVRRNKFGVELLLGTEVNIMDYEGNLDLDDVTLSNLDLCIASLHIPCIPQGTVEDHTNAIIGAMKNPYINIIGHPDDSRFILDYEKIVKSAKEYHVLLEVNNSSLSPNSFRLNARENYTEMLKYCKEYEVPIVLGSDAHVSDDVGNHLNAKELLKTIGFPEELVVNTSVEKFKSFIKGKR